MASTPSCSAITLWLLAGVLNSTLWAQQPVVVPSAPSRVYMFVFSYQRISLTSFNHAHTFAHFIRMEQPPGSIEPTAIESATISWYPADTKGKVDSNLGVKRFAFQSRTGKNMTLEETFNDARELKARVTCWGPYEIDPSRWGRVQSQLAVLNSGHLRWQALDLCGRQQGTSINCIHAVADLDYSKGQLKTKRTFGTGASRLVTAHLRSWVISHGPQHDWLFRYIPTYGCRFEREPLPCPNEMHMEHERVACPYEHLLSSYAHSPNTSPAIIIQ